MAAIAICGSWAGAKPMNQGWLRPSRSISAVPVLPAKTTPSTVSPDAVPSWVTRVIISVSWAAASSLIARASSSGSSSRVTRPSGSVTCWRNVGFISVPSLATAAATSAI